MKSEVCLGFHIGHDRGAAIVKNGLLIGAISEERLDRIKHSYSDTIPFKSIDALLEDLGLSIADIGCVAFSGAAFCADSAKSFLQQQFYEHYNVSGLPFYAVDHHLAHAWSAYCSSGYENAFVLVADGGGDYIGDMMQSESLYHFSKGEAKLVEVRYQHPPIGPCTKGNAHIFPYMPNCLKDRQISLGRKYEQITHFIGFGWGQAGKTMGLAPYGNRSFLPHVKPGDCQGLHFDLKYRDILEQIDEAVAASSATYLQFRHEHRADVAELVQRYTEECIISAVSSLAHTYDIDSICFAGGLFLNCVLNCKILEACPQLTRTFFMPASGDDGQAIGCAFYGTFRHYRILPGIDDSFPFLGLGNRIGDIQDELDRLKGSVSFSELPIEKLVETVARAISNSEVVGLVRGRTEIGPRALCHRSILADATDSMMKDRLNGEVKHREDFRPFAPVVCAEDASRFFDLHTDSPYMLLAPTVRARYRDKLPAVTHVNGSARVQTIREPDDPFAYAVLKELEMLSGYPVAINTSFNIAGEPVVESAKDALSTFLRTRIDLLVLENFAIRKRRVK